MNTKYNCDRCAHNTVCRHKDEYRNDVDAIKNAISQSPTTVVKIECRHFLMVSATKKECAALPDWETAAWEEEKPKIHPKTPPQSLCGMT